MFISNAFADAGTAQSGGIMAFLPLVAFIAILYFLLIRPQQKRQKQHQELISSIKKGDKVVTNSGMVATVSKIVSEHEVVLEIANGVHCRFVKASISDIVNDVKNESISIENSKSNESPVSEMDPANAKDSDDKEKDMPVKKVSNRKVTKDK